MLPDIRTVCHVSGSEVFELKRSVYLPDLTSAETSITFTFSAVSHAPLRGLQVVDQEVAAVPHGDGDPEEAAVLGAAVEELPGGAGRELADLAGPRQGGVLQREPHRSLSTTAVHLQEGLIETVITCSEGVITPSTWTEAAH